MADQKFENLLNLALDATEKERERSQELNVGYNPLERTWEVIVKYSGEISGLRERYPGIRVVELLNEYAILTVPESLLMALSDIPEIEYIEKPKRLFFAVNQGKAASCINQVQGGIRNLTGKGVLVAIIDSGIDYFHKDFQNSDGTTRILRLWDQTLGADGEEVYENGGRIFTKEQIDEALAAGSRMGGLKIVPSVDLSGHGTAVTGIAAGNGQESNGQYRGIAYESDLIIVKLGTPIPDSFPRTTELMKALDYVIRTALELKQPVAVNISFGNAYGSHDGTSLLESYINDMANYWKSVIVIGTGNEGASAGHTSGTLTMGQDTDIELSVAPYETGFSVQIWKPYVDDFDISIISPSNVVLGPIQDIVGTQRLHVQETELLIYYGEPSPYSQSQEIYIDFIPVENYVNSGIWKFRLTPKRIVSGQFDLWLPGSAVLNRSTRFLRPTPDTTLTIPSTALKAISVGAYDDAYRLYADFSGRGYTRITNLVKPDLVAPGVNIITTASGGGYTPMTGTSFATPFVTGSAALLMEYGIVMGNDPFLYGEKVKAYLIRGANQLPGFSMYPNPQLGWGALCLKNSFPS